MTHCDLLVKSLELEDEALQFQPEDASLEDGTEELHVFVLTLTASCEEEPNSRGSQISNIKKQFSDKGKSVRDGHIV